MDGAWGASPPAFPSVGGSRLHAGEQLSSQPHGTMAWRAKNCAVAGFEKELRRDREGVGGGLKRHTIGDPGHPIACHVSCARTRYRPGW